MMKVEVYIQHRRVISVISLTTALEKPLGPLYQPHPVPASAIAPPFRHLPLSIPKVTRVPLPDMGRAVTAHGLYIYGMPHWI